MLKYSAAGRDWQCNRKTYGLGERGWVKWGSNRDVHTCTLYVCGSYFIAGETQLHVASMCILCVLSILILVASCLPYATGCG